MWLRGLLACQPSEAALDNLCTARGGGLTAGSCYMAVIARFGSLP